MEEHCSPLQEGDECNDVDELLQNNVFGGAADGFEGEDEGDNDHCKCHNCHEGFWLFQQEQGSARGHKRIETGGPQFLRIVFVTRFSNQ